jgi:hypothetical protein
MGKVAKKQRILALLRSGHGLNRFEVEGLGAHSIKITASLLRRKGYLFLAMPEQLLTWFGNMVRVLHCAPISDRCTQKIPR